MLSIDEICRNVWLDLYQKQLFIANSLGIHVLCVQLQHVVDISAMESLVEELLLFLSLFLFVLTIFVFFIVFLFLLCIGSLLLSF